MPNRMKEFRGMSDEQLALALKDTEKHLFQLRFQSATDRLETPSEIRKARRDIARIRTLMREKELTKLGGLSTEQLGVRIRSLQEKEDAGLPGKRTAHRQGARLRRFYADKGGTFPIPAPVAVAPAPASAANTPATGAGKADAKTDAKKDAKDTKKTAVKGSGK
ncbi:MAG: 50S ribosomal protein L29 [Gemmataceae bacterium]|nr:50S ribosomal protein L29 [Gemmataceae bacterium]